MRVDYLVNTGGRNGVFNAAANANQLGTTYFDGVTGTNARLSLNFDARSNTEYGLLRGFAQFSAYRAPLSGAVSSGALVASGVGQSQRQSNILMERAFIQFAGFTFGFSASFFNFYQGDVSFTRPFGATATATTVLAYTASMGNGFSATVSLEDAQYRRWGNSDQFVTNPTGNGAATGLMRPESREYGLTYGAVKLPDIVANLRVDQGWGSVQLMGALHQLTDYGRANAAGTFQVGPGLIFPNATNFAGQNAGGNTVTAADRFGYAVGAGLRLNLDMLARGDVLWLQAVYADGAVDYAFTVANQGGDRASISGAGNLFQAGGTTVHIRDGFVNTATNRIETTKVWSLSAGFRHFWTPALRSSIFGSYTNLDAPAIALSFPGQNASDFRYWMLGVNTTWSPVRNLDIGLEIVYHSLSSRRNNTTGGGVGAPNTCPVFASAANPAATKCTDTAWTGLMRVQRNF